MPRVADFLDIRVVIILIVSAIYSIPFDGARPQRRPTQKDKYDSILDFSNNFLGKSYSQDI